jgi:lauroyl/myristoyl acyltransferase
MNLSLEMVNSYDRLVLLRLLNDLRKKRLVFLMADYPVSMRKNDGHIKFLGYNTIPTRGAAWLHKKTGAPIVPIMFRYVDGQELRLEVLDEIQTDAACDLSKTTQMVYDVLEKRILEAPESWALWLDYHLMVPPGVKN